MPDRTEDRAALLAAGLSESQVAEMLPSEPVAPPFQLWPENRVIWDLWCALRTQWRVCPAGIAGLDYVAVPAVMELQAIPHEERAALFSQLQACESVALEEFYKGK